MVSPETMQNLQDGSVIMLIGMGVVFAFLTIMVYTVDLCTIIMKKLNEIFPEEVEEQSKPTRKSSKEEDEKIALAIAIAHAKAQRQI